MAATLVFSAGGRDWAWAGVWGGMRRSSGGREEATTSPASWVPLSGATGFTCGREFLGCHLDFSRPVPPPRILWGWAELDWAGDGHRAGRPPRCKAGPPDEHGRIKPDHKSAGAHTTEQRGFPRGDLSEAQFFPLPFGENSQQPQAAHLPHRVAKKITESCQV